MSETKAEYFVTGYEADWNDPEPEPVCKWTTIDVTHFPGCNSEKSVWPREPIDDWKYCPFCGREIGW